MGLIGAVYWAVLSVAAKVDGKAVERAGKKVLASAERRDVSMAV